MEHSKDADTDVLTLCDTQKLYAKYESFNDRYFNNKLPPAKDVAIEWSTRLTTSAGNCRVQRNKSKKKNTKGIIRLSVHYHQKYPEEVDSTLLHEMIHILVPGHGPEFKSWINHINKQGGKVLLHSKEPAALPKWEYKCVSCGIKIYRRRRFEKLAAGAYKCKYCGGKFKEKKLR